LALITAELFAALLGQRDIEHQDELLDDFSILHSAGGCGQDRRTAAWGDPGVKRKGIPGGFSRPVDLLRV
jgi:hypothetical protein